MRRYTIHMKYTIITDSCCNFYKRDITTKNVDFISVPLTLIVGDQEFVDDESLDTTEFIKIMGEYNGHARSACPSPQAFYDAMVTGDNIIVITISSKLSGTYASAFTAAEMLRTNFPEKKLFLVDSLSAAAGEDYLVIELLKLIEENKYTFDEITVKLSEIRAKHRVRFLLQDLSNLVKNGRMSKMAGKILTTARIKLICGEDGKGEIKKYAMSMGTKRGLCTLAELPAKEISKDMPICIAHVHNEEDATFLKNILKVKHGFKNISIRLMRGLSTLYSADKGIVIAY